MSNDNQYDIFLSYNRDHKRYVENLYEKLCNLNLNVWIDYKELDHTPLMVQIAKGINNSRVFICCVTKKYSESENLRKEFFYAISEKKPIIILMFEPYEKISEEIKIEINTKRR